MYRLKLQLIDFLGFVFLELIYYSSYYRFIYYVIFLYFIEFIIFNYMLF